MVMLILVLILGCAVYKAVADASKPQMAFTESDVYAREGILHMELIQNGGSEHDNFTFEVEINGEAYSGEGVVNGTVQKISSGKIRLKGGQTAAIGSIPYGSTCRITQRRDISYDTEVNGEPALEITDTINEKSAEVTAVFENTWKSGELRFRAVRKGGIKDTDFPFTVKIGGILYSGQAEINGSEVSVINGIIRLKDGETAQITDIPFGTDYKIIQQPTEGYKVVVDGLETATDAGIISGQNPKPLRTFENISTEGWNLRSILLLRLREILEYIIGAA